MPIKDELKDYFEKLVKPLVTNANMEEILGKFKREVISKFEETITEQEKRITRLESTLALRENTIDVLLLSKLEVKADDNEQYSRRSCLRIHGIRYDENSSNENMEDILSNCYEKVDVPFDPNEIDRVHRIGKPVIDKQTGEKSKMIIVKFKSWKSRCEFYRARPKAFQDGKKNPGQIPFSISLDLTKNRYDILKSARGIIKGNSKVSYVFSDINCSLGLKTDKGKFLYFNTINKFNDIIDNIN